MNSYEIDWSGKARQACPACQKPRDTALHLMPNGVAYCHRCRSTWRRDEGSTIHAMRARTAAESARVSSARDDAERHGEVAGLAQTTWRVANLVEDGGHPYLRRKGCLAHGTRVDADGRLLVPMLIAGDLVNLQRIDAQGEKRFMPGGKARGATYTLKDCTMDDGVVFVAEGFATAATVHEASGLPCLVAFSAGNLGAAVLVARRMFPADVVIVAADNDDDGHGHNPGIEAAAEVGAQFVAPGERGDWNDMLVRYGWPGVTHWLREAERLARAAR